MTTSRMYSAQQLDRHYHGPVTDPYDVTLKESGLCYPQTSPSGLHLEVEPGGAMRSKAIWVKGESACKTIIERRCWFTAKELIQSLYKIAKPLQMPQTVAWLARN